MGRISTIVLDEVLVGGDSVLGTETATGKTINISLDALSSFIGDGDAALTQDRIQTVILDKEGFRADIGATVPATQAIIETAIIDDSAFRTAIGAGTSSVVLNQTNIETAITEPADFRSHVGAGTSDVVLNQANIESAITDFTAFRERINVERSDALRPDTAISVTSVAFPAGTAGTGVTIDSNTLDDYEEGTFTPATSGSIGALISSSDARYIRVGGLVHIQLVAEVTTALFGSIHEVSLSGLPFTTDGQTGISAVLRSPSGDSSVIINAQVFSSNIVFAFSAAQTNQSIRIFGTYDTND